MHIATKDAQVWATIEDDFHHFSVTLDRRGDVVVNTATASIRHTDSSCPAPAAPQT